MEAGFNITQDLALKLLGAHEMLRYERTDYYIEAYDGESFLLSPRRLKFRVKDERDGFTAQTNLKSELHKRRCDQFEYEIRLKDVGELNLPREQGRPLVSQMRTFAELARVQDIPALRKVARALHERFSALPVPQLDALKALIPGERPWRFVTTYSSDKSKWKRTINMGHGKMQFSITHARDYVGMDFIQEKFEIEFEARGGMLLDEFSESVCAFIRRHQVTGEDANPARATTNHVALSRLNELGVTPEALAAEPAPALPAPALPAPALPAPAVDPFVSPARPQDPRLP
ncbi:MAG: hypothetical protein FJ138_09970 [Deltaproteobacteria bacterium]|nr:hypothetical protein [Deltaproteobacteria bacterium]